MRFPWFDSFSFVSFFFFVLFSLICFPSTPSLPPFDFDFHFHFLIMFSVDTVAFFGCIASSVVLFGWRVEEWCMKSISLANTNTYSCFPSSNAFSQYVIYICTDFHIRKERNFFCYWRQKLENDCKMIESGTSGTTSTHVTNNDQRQRRRMNEKENQPKIAEQFDMSRQQK